MTPLNARRAASAYAKEHCAGNEQLRLLLVEAFINGYQYCDSQQPSSALIQPVPCASAQEIEESFDTFWSLYDYKKAKPQAQRMWQKLSLSQKKEIMESLPAYIESTPDKKYRMHPATYINPANKRWRDEIITQTPTANEQQQRLSSYAEAIARVAEESQ